MKIYYHPQLRKSYNALPISVKSKAEQKERLFLINPFDPRLKTHRLHGRLKNQWSFSVDRNYRILFEFLDRARQEVVFLDIGTHEIYK